MFQRRIWKLVNSNRPYKDNSKLLKFNLILILINFYFYKENGNSMRAWCDQEETVELFLQPEQ